jgi:Lecithin retinol acyltransferase
MNQFSPGAHLQVRRGIYYHHGVYISDDRVIQFGSGASLRDKHSTRIDAVTLADFEHGGTAVVVRHGYESWFTGHHPAADEPWKVIARAEFLLKLQPGLPYNLIGHNCEIIANMCASGSWTESYQVRRGFGVRAYTSAATLLYIAWLGRRKLPQPSWLYAWVIIGSAVSIAARTTYNHGIKKLWDEIREDWLAHEHMLGEDPHNGRASRKGPTNVPPNRTG